ncbi:lipoprotein [Escherichia coli]|uniref:Lipoprotein n=1 Tax=Escherichia coli TaxID=562 RepID=A0A2X1L2Y8_ECOLX|nr:lipoprotein [Escherichia coli]
MQLLKSLSHDMHSISCGSRARILQPCLPASPEASLQAHSGRVSFDWEGDALELLSELARLRGQQFSYSGVRLPLPVSLHVRDMTFADALRLTEAQTAWRAVLSQSAGRLHLSYMPTEKK